MHDTRSMKVVLATDSFKGCLTSQQVEAALAVRLQVRGMQVVSVPMSDGGEGMLHAFAEAMGGTMHATQVHDPLMRPVTAHYAVCPDGTAIVETAQACGLTLLSPTERDPLKASTYGVGELLLAALRAGCRRYIVGLGGSGTSDCGRGMLQALADNLTGGNLHALANHPLTSTCRFILASDVQNPLYGPTGAAMVYGRQKGATPDMQLQLDRQARKFARQSALALGHDSSLLPGAGAAGGLGYAFLQYLHAEAQPGADILLHEVRFGLMLAGADLVITGEGSADLQTLMGKLPLRVLHYTRRCCQAPVWLIAGRVADHNKLIQAGFQRVCCINAPGDDMDEAMRPEVATSRLARWAKDNL